MILDNHNHFHNYYHFCTFSSAATETNTLTTITCTRKWIICFALMDQNHLSPTHPERLAPHLLFWFQNPSRQYAVTNRERKRCIARHLLLVRICNLNRITGENDYIFGDSGQPDRCVRVAITIHDNRLVCIGRCNQRRFLIQSRNKVGGHKPKTNQPQNCSR